MKVDFHIHSSMSDGLYSPETLIRQAQEKSVEIMAFTDHECVTLSASLLDMAASCHIRLIYGLELLTRYREHDVHVLAYFNQAPGASLLRQVAVWGDQRTQAAYRLAARLRKMGINIDLSAGTQDGLPRATRTHSHVLYGLHHNYPHLSQPALRDMIASAFAAVEPFEEYMAPSFEEAVDTVRRGGGLPVIAHPGLLQDFPFIENLLSVRPVGLEVYYGYWYNTKELVEQYARLAQTSALAATGGSDYHGAFSRFDIGEIEFPTEKVELFLDVLRKVSIGGKGL